MDKIFEKFYQWYKEKESDWNTKGIIIEKEHLEEKRGHHYSIHLKCESGLGNIVLYESNGEYWIYLEAGNYDYDVMFIRDNIKFLVFRDIDGVVADMIEHMAEAL